MESPHFRLGLIPPTGRPPFRVGLWISERSAALFEDPRPGDLEKGEEFLEGWGSPPPSAVGAAGRGESPRRGAAAG